MPVPLGLLAPPICLPTPFFVTAVALAALVLDALRGTPKQSAGRGCDRKVVATWVMPLRRGLREGQDGRSRAAASSAPPKTRALLCSATRARKSNSLPAALCLSLSLALRTARQPVLDVGARARAPRWRVCLSGAA